MKIMKRIIALLCIITLMTVFFAACNKNPSYKIRVGSIENGSVEVDKTKAKADEIVSVNAKPNVGFKLKPLSLKFNGIIVPGNSFKMPSKDAVITAEFDYINENERLVSVAEMKNGKVELEKEYFAEGEKVYLFVTPDDGYRLKDGTLKYNGNGLTEELSFDMPFVNVVVTAEFEKLPSGYGSIVIEKSVNGRIVSDKSNAQQGSTITIKIIPLKGYQIKLGTLKYNGNEISGTAFIMPNSQKVIITAEFIKTEYLRVNEKGETDDSGKYMLFGNFPKTLKQREVKITPQIGEDGYYLGSDGAKYVKYKTNLSHSNRYLFSDGKTIVNNNVEYYFKLEPIMWRILSEDNGDALLQAINLIDSEVFLSGFNIDSDGYNIKTGVPPKTFANNWKYSDVREYLNGALFSSMFTETHKYFVSDTIVDGEANKLFLPSYEDMTNAKYGFLPNMTRDGARIKITTDYARARSARLYTGVGYGTAEYWLRTASDIKNAYSATFFGDFSTAAAVNTFGKGIAPMVTIKFD